MPRTQRIPSRRRRLARRRRITVLAAVILCAVLSAAVLWRAGPAEQQALPADAPVQPAAPAPLQAPSAQGTAALTQAWIYGTHMGLRGTLESLPLDTQQLQLVLCAGQEVLQSWPLLWQPQDAGAAFRLSDTLNTGVDLEALPECEGCLVVRACLSDGSTVDHLLTAGAAESDLPFTYYTLTRAGTNRRIDISSETLQTPTGSGQGLGVRCAGAQLPAQVYDVVIDPGHGGSDAGSVSADGHYESDIVLDIAMRTKAQLEALGLKVLLTRDGTEDPEKLMAYAMYDEDGRVNVTAGSGAKLCLSLHLNSYEGYLAQGGVQIYAGEQVDYGFARALAQSVAQTADTPLSSMEAYAVGGGVFCRTFTQADVDELDLDCTSHGAQPYDRPVGTQYYYIIRETGGRMTGAYVDGRHPHYGTNLYRDSAIGVESYLCELGYITQAEDLQKLLQTPDAYARALAAAVAARYGL